MNDCIDLTADVFKDLYNCVRCGKVEGTTTFAMEQVGTTEQGTTRCATSGLCESCITDLQDPKHGETAHRKLEERLTNELAEIMEARNG